MKLEREREVEKEMTNLNPIVYKRKTHKSWIILYRKFTLTVPGGQNKAATLTLIFGKSFGLQQTAEN